MKRRTIIKFQPALFWDIDVRTLDPEKHSSYIIERVLDFGNDQEVAWLFSRYSPRMIKGVLHQPRGTLHKKSKALWSLVLR